MPKNEKTPKPPTNVKVEKTPPKKKPSWTDNFFNALQAPKLPKQ